MNGKTKGNKKNKLSKGDYKDALIKKALGYDSTEVVEEYATVDDGEIKLVKKKVTIKPVPPDTTALKILLSSDELTPEKMTDEELESELKRLLKLISDNS